MSLDTTATTEWNGMTEIEAANRFVDLYQQKGYVQALAFHSSLPPILKEFICHSSISEGYFNDAREQLEGDLRLW